MQKYQKWPISGSLPILCWTTGGIWIKKGSRWFCMPTFHSMHQPPWIFIFIMFNAISFGVCFLCNRYLIWKEISCALCVITRLFSCYPHFHVFYSGLGFLLQLPPPPSCSGNLTWTTPPISTSCWIERAWLWESWWKRRMSCRSAKHRTASSCSSSPRINVCRSWSPSSQRSPLLIWRRKLASSKRNTALHLILLVLAKWTPQHWLNQSHEFGTGLPVSSTTARWGCVQETCSKQPLFSVSPSNANGMEITHFFKKFKGSISCNLEFCMRVKKFQMQNSLVLKLVRRNCCVDQ